MAEIKTKQTNADVHEFINSFADTEQKRKDSFELLQLMQKTTGCEPKIWGPTMIGFGSFHLPFRYTCIQEANNTGIYYKTWGSLKWARPAFTLKNFQTLTKRNSKI